MVNFACILMHIIHTHISRILDWDIITIGLNMKKNKLVGEHVNEVKWTKHNILNIT